METMLLLPLPVDTLSLLLVVDVDHANDDGVLLPDAADRVSSKDEIESCRSREDSDFETPPLGVEARDTPSITPNEGQPISCRRTEQRRNTSQHTSLKSALPTMRCRLPRRAAVQLIHLDCVVARLF